MNNNFALVREAFCSNLAESLRRLSVTVKAATAKGDWLQIACPMCTDKSGSASVSTKSGFLRCHQCGAKADLFTWTGAHLQLSEKPWDVCQQLAALLGVHVAAAGKGNTKWRNVPPITPAAMTELKARLFESEDSEIARGFLRSRHLWDPVLLERLPIGAFGRCIVFFQHDQEGRLLSRGKVYDPTPMQGSPKWTYSKGAPGGSSRTVSMWPFLDSLDGFKDDSIVVLTEGEWDCMSAIMRLRLNEAGTIVQCWTGGGGAPIPPDAIPAYFRNREVHVVYDNDVFQGLGEDLAPDDKKASEMKIRKKNLIEAVGGSLQSNRCKVFIRAITIPPLAQWGADLRDMIDAGLTDINTLPIFSLKECRQDLQKPKAIAFAEVHKHLGEYVEFECQVGGVSDDVIITPKRHVIDCPQGSKKPCEYCGVPKLAPNGVLEWSLLQDRLACALTSTNVPRYIIDQVCSKPTSCREWQVTPMDASDGARWHAMAKEDDEAGTGRAVEIISHQNPPLSGTLKVRGWLYISANGVTPVLMCDKLEAMDRIEMPVQPHKVDFLHHCPANAERPEQIDEYLERWHADISNNTTHIYGRRDLHVLLLLTMHSVLWYDVGGARRRGWIDSCLIGATRTGKSNATRAYLKAVFGQHFTPMGNFSRPGMTIGTVNLNGQNKSRPGVFPRNHGKLLAMDESHLMVQDNQEGGSLFPMLQGARDIGRVEAAKISGSMVLPAAVRLIAIANYLNGGRNSFATPAQHLLALYGTPESLARLDFAVPVDEMEAGFGPQDVPQFWTSERQRTLAIRAWNMTPEQVHIDKDAYDYVIEICSGKWKARYTEELPLFTEKEKVYSVLRIAIAIANATFSYFGDDIYSCHVRLVHVLWACQWLEHTWHLLEYDTMSTNAMAVMGDGQAWAIEGLLTVGLDLSQAEAVGFVLGRLYGQLGRDELRTVVGKGLQDFEPWVMRMIRCGGIEVVRPPGRSQHVGFRLTKGAIEILAKLVTLAENDHGAWSHRYNKMQSWMSSNGPARNSEPLGLSPIYAPTEIHLDDYRRSGLG